MKKYILLLGIILTAFIVTSNTKDNEQSNEKITICHIPPGNPENAHSIEISVHAWPAHQAHGDVIGNCSDFEREQEDIHKNDTTPTL
ncbi:MAG: hypothetical protein ACPG45_06895 [Flavobacteriaceae bacterium]